MRGMKTVMLFVLLGLSGISATFAQSTTVTTGNELSTMTKGIKEDSGWFEDEENYHKSLAFKKQVGITQIATGGAFLPGGLAMIAVGTHKMNVADRQASSEETVSEEAVMGRKAGIIMVTTGSITSVAGALLIMKGCDTLKEIRNRKGDVVGQVGLSGSGIIGMSMKF